MKIAIRTIALSLVITGVAAGAFSKTISPSNQVVPSAVPVPTCPLTGPGAGGCGVWQ